MSTYKLNNLHAVIRVIYLSSSFIISHFDKSQGATRFAIIAGYMLL